MNQLWKFSPRGAGAAPFVRDAGDQAMTVDLRQGVGGEQDAGVVAFGVAGDVVAVADVGEQVVQELGRPDVERLVGDAVAADPEAHPAQVADPVDERVADPIGDRGVRVGGADRDRAGTGHGQLDRGHGAGRGLDPPGVGGFAGGAPAGRVSGEGVDLLDDVVDAVVMAVLVHAVSLREIPGQGRESP